MKRKLLFFLCLSLFVFAVAGCAKKEYHNPAYGYAFQNQDVFNQQYAACEAQCDMMHPAMEKPARPPYRYHACFEAAGRTTQPPGCTGRKDTALKQYKMGMMEYEANEDQRAEVIRECMKANGWQMEAAPAK